MKLDDIRKSNTKIPNPKKQSDFRVTSNETGELIETLFDYDKVNEHHITAAKEILSLLENRKNLPINFLKEEIKNRFKVSDIPEMKIEDSLWYKFTQEENLGANIQGFRIKVNEDGTKIKIPYIAFSSDLEYLNNMIVRLMNKILDIMEKENANKI